MLDELDKYFLKKSFDSSYSIYLQFKHYKRDNTNVSEYIQEFERRYNRLKKLELKLPDEILGCKLLENSCLEKHEKQMVLTSVKTLKFDDVKGSMKRIFFGYDRFDYRKQFQKR